jgi:hypothetical protein
MDLQGYQENKCHRNNQGHGHQQGEDMPHQQEVKRVLRL